MELYEKTCHISPNGPTGPMGPWTGTVGTSWTVGTGGRAGGAGGTDGRDRQAGQTENGQTGGRDGWTGAQDRRAAIKIDCVNHRRVEELHAQRDPTFLTLRAIAAGLRITLCQASFVSEQLSRSYCNPRACCYAYACASAAGQHTCRRLGDRA